MKRRTYGVACQCGHTKEVTTGSKSELARWYKGLVLDGWKNVGPGCLGVATACELCYAGVPAACEKHPFPEGFKIERLGTEYIIGCPHCVAKWKIDVDKAEGIGTQLFLLNHLASHEVHKCPINIQSNT